MAVLRRTAVVVLLGVLGLSGLLAGCADDGRVEGDRPMPSIEPRTGDPTVAVVFDEPLSLAQVQELAARHKASVVALWRTDTACVPDEARVFESRDPRRQSAFAYWEADDIVARRLVSKGPPVTDGGRTFRMWDRFKLEWESAQAPGRTFAGAALLLPVDGPVKDKAVARSEPVTSYRIPDDDVLYLTDHDAALARLFPKTPTGPC